MLILLALALSLSAHADDCLNRDPLSSYRDLIHRTAVVDEDGRRTEEQYAIEKALPLSRVQNQFAATGVIKCKGVRATAQLTGATNIITTAAHIFHERWTCNRVSDPESCTFTVKVGTRERTSKIKSSVIGYKCPQESNRLDDWAVLTLDKEIADVTPYDIPQRNEVVREKDQVVSVSAGSSDFSIIDNKGKRKFLPQTKTIDECEVKRTIVFDVMARFESDCDGGPGISGGGILRRSGNRYVLMGITTNTNATSEQEQNAIRTGVPLTGSYSPNSWANYHLPLSGGFLKAVEKAVSANSI